MRRSGPPAQQTHQSSESKPPNKTQPGPGDGDKSDIRAYIKDDAMVTILHKRGITSLFPIQYETFHAISKGEDIVAKDRTGSGKTLAFALPTITRMRSMSKFKANHNPKFLIILPTR